MWHSLAQHSYEGHMTSLGVSLCLPTKTLVEKKSLKKTVYFTFLYVNVLAACMSVHYIHTVSQTGVANIYEPPSEC